MVGTWIAWPALFPQINPHALVFAYDRTIHNPEGILEAFQRDKNTLKQYLQWIAKDANQFNVSLPTKIVQHLEARHQKLLQDREGAAHLGFPLKRRPDAPTTYVAPDVKRWIPPSLPSVSTEPYKPEPVLDIVEYEHILSVISNMVMVMERSPCAFRNMAEENLRQHFLVQLNGQYEGQATGETFNYKGKTDILIRAQGKNIFIAECKFWKGPASLTRALDQLLGYVSWRDTKTALLLFNQSRDLTAVLKRIPGVIKAHPHCKRECAYASDTGFRYIFGHRDDANRELRLTVLVFDVPA